MDLIADGIELAKGKVKEKMGVEKPKIVIDDEPFENKKCRNAGCGVFFLLVALLVVAFGVWGTVGCAQTVAELGFPSLGREDGSAVEESVKTDWFGLMAGNDDLDTESTADTTGNSSVAASVSSESYANYAEKWRAVMPHNVIVGGIVFGVVLVIAILWFIVLRFAGKKVVKFTMVMCILWSIVACVVGLAAGAILPVALPLGFAFVIILVYKIVWYICMKQDIKFATVLVGASLEGPRAQPSIMMIGIVGFLIQLVLAALVFASVLHFSYDHAQTYVICIFAYWVFEDIRSLTYIAIASTFGHWYFYYPNEGKRRFPALGAIGQVLSTSYGTAARGAFSIGALRGFGCCIDPSGFSKRALCCLGCDRCTRNMNTRAYVFAGVYGQDFRTAGKYTAAIIESFGLGAAMGQSIIKDIHRVCVWITGLMSFVLSFVLSMVVLNCSWDIALPLSILITWLVMSVMTIHVTVLDACLSTLLLLFGLDNGESLKDDKSEAYIPLNRAWTAVQEAKRERDEYKDKAADFGKRKAKSAYNRVFKKSNLHIDDTK